MVVNIEDKNAGNDHSSAACFFIPVEVSITYKWCRFQRRSNGRKDLPELFWPGVFLRHLYANQRAEDFVDYQCGILTVNGRNRFLNLNPIGFVRENVEQAFPETLQELVSPQVNNTRVDVEFEVQFDFRLIRRSPPAWRG
jgi:hypothetical protein